MNQEPASELGHLFRREAGRLTAALTRVFGLHNLVLAEDVVQDALCHALEVWKLRGVPDNPGAWLLAVAENRAVDVLRRDKRLREFSPDLSRLLESEWTLLPTVDEMLKDEVIRDDQLRMMFSCCHPRLGDEPRVAIILSLLCGFSAREVATAFLSNPAAMEKRLSRAKKIIASSGHLFDPETDADLKSRLDDVLRALYLLFNEGYHGSHPERTIRQELCEEALRLMGLLIDHPATRSPQSLALAALLSLHAARLPGRLDEAGELAPLGAQDRTKWDRALIDRGLALLNASATGDRVTAYHIEAAIAAEHALAASVETTHWGRIVGLYDKLLELDPSPVVALSRAVALAQERGPEQGLRELARLANEKHLVRYPFFEAARGELELVRGRTVVARGHFEQAAKLARSTLERRYLERRARACSA